MAQGAASNVKTDFSASKFPPMQKTLRILSVDPEQRFGRQLAQALSGHDDFSWIEPRLNVENALDFNGDPPDVIVFEADLLGGLALIEKTQAFNRANPEKEDIGVLIIAKRSRKEAEETIEALEAGAFDFVIRQELADERTVIDSLARQITVKLRRFSSKRIFSSFTASSAMAGAARVPDPEAKPPARLRALLIGVSTGGPKVLSTLIPGLAKVTDLPVLIVQHMPVGFTASLARSLDAKCAHRVVEASEGDVIESRTVYIAPGGRHMLVKNGVAQAPFITLSDDPPEEGCRPSANILFRSAASVYGSSAAAIVLTGMGSDGVKGLRELKSAGAFSMAQDEASSVVWGMPGNAVAAGLIDNVLRPGDMPGRIQEFLKAARSCTWI